jgi:hypothetical protein
MSEQEKHTPTTDSPRMPPPCGTEEAEGRNHWESYSPEILEAVLDP